MYDSTKTACISTNKSWKKRQIIKNGFFNDFSLDFQPHRLCKVHIYVIN